MYALHKKTLKIKDSTKKDEAWKYTSLNALLKMTLLFFKA
jgi:hypothetical protein